MGFNGPNSKASAAREKKKQVAQEKANAKQKSKELELEKQWETGSKKPTKRELELEKRQQQSDEKRIREEILLKEQNSIKSINARNIDDAVELFKKDTIDRHPERRVKAAYELFRQRRIKEIRQDNPSLKLSQIQQQVWKEFKKSSENPMNQDHAQYNTSKADVDKLEQNLTETKLEKMQI
eukprot:NODE_170_length_14437_cov_1.447273.p9 type:complete len:181 gc:universal NODE_170_length_14437_cov_1.447273:2082-1540(-)